MTENNGKFIFQEHYELDWEDIERKVQIISRRFQNIDIKYREDLEQELRLYAFTTSAHYSHLYRKAIDYWRTLSRKVYPEVCIFDVEDNEGNKLLVPEEEYEDMQEDGNARRVLEITRKELNRYAQTNREKIIVEISLRILEIMEKDAFAIPDMSLKDIKTSRYKKGRLSISWITDQTGYDYKKVQEAMNVIGEIVSTLFRMGKFDSDNTHYFTDK